MHPNGTGWNLGPGGGRWRMTQVEDREQQRKGPRAHGQSNRRSAPLVAKGVASTWTGDGDMLLILAVEISGRLRGRNYPDFRTGARDIQRDAVLFAS